MKKRKTKYRKLSWIDKITILLVISVLILSIGIYLVGKQIYPNVGTYLIVLSSFIIYVSLVVLAWKI